MFQTVATFWTFFMFLRCPLATIDTQRACQKDNKLIIRKIAKQSGVRKWTVVRLESNNQLKKQFIYYETEYCLPLHPINYQNQTMKKNSKKHILLLSASGVLLICLISIYLSRNALLRSIVDKRTSHIEQTHGLRIHYDNLEMNGLNEIILEGLSVYPNNETHYWHSHPLVSNWTSGNY